MIVLKVTLVLAAGALAALALRHRSAALRHLIWTGSLAAALGVGLATPLLPTVTIAVPTAWTGPLQLPAPTETVTAVQRVAVVPTLAPAPMPASPASAAARGASAAELARALWIAGMLAVMGWCLLGRLGLARLLRQAEPLEDAGWLESLDAARLVAGVRAKVRLYRSERIGSPATWGLARPVIVLPPVATGWSAAQRRTVLDHELAHIARRDGLAGSIGWAACTVYWFHPLVWVAAHCRRLEAEHAADDAVLARGAGPVDYAAQLLDVARKAKTLRALGVSAIAMARPSHLEGRLLAVLDETRSRAVPRASTRRALWTAFASLALPVAALEPVADVTRHVTQVVGGAAADTTFEETFPARPGELLELDLQTGGEVRIEGWERRAIRVRATLAGPDARHTLISLNPQPPGLRITTRMDRERQSYSTSHRFEIMVPKTYDVRLESSGGGLTLLGVEGSFTGETGGGELRLERASGRAELSTGGGDIEVRESNLAGHVSTGGGTVNLVRVEGGLHGSTGGGDVITETGRGSDRRRIDRAGGAIDFGPAPEGADVNTGGGDIRIGAGAGRVHARTGGGDITIGPIDGEIEAVSGAGTFRGTLINPHGSVSYETGKGDAIVTVPRDFDGRFELEAAYTRGQPRTKIESDWELTPSETDQWDSREGSPRKYLRASGRAGRGAGLVRIKVVNGNISIRRAR